MNTEYAIVQQALRNPNITVELKRQGFRYKFFNDKDLAKAWNLINQTFVNLGSIPTAEELARYNVIENKEEIPHTVQHLANNIVNARNIALLGQVSLDAAKALTDDEDSIISSTKLMIDGISKLIILGEDKKYVESSDISDEVWEQYKLRNEWNTSGQQGITLGLDILDKHIKNIRKGWMVLVAARNGVGKSWFLCNAALKAWKQKRTIAIFSCEMTKVEFLERMHCIDAQINPTRFRDAESTLEELERFKLSKENAKSNYGTQYVCDNPGDFDSIREMLKEMNEKNPTRPIEAIYIDAVYLLDMAGESDNVQQKNISKAIKKLAKDFDCPVIATTQMNREYGKENDGKKKLKGGGYSIAGSDGFNQNSDVIILLNKNEEAYESFHYIDMILQKFRHGQDGIPYIIEMNLNKPELKQVDFQFARTRIDADFEPETAKKIFETTSKIFQKNESIFEKDILPNNVLETFKNHQENLEQQIEKNNLENLDGDIE